MSAAHGREPAPGGWGYLICGPMRTSALFPLMVVLAFGAFALRWRQIAALTAPAVASLVDVVALGATHPRWVVVQETVDPLRVDINNVLVILVALPALAVIAARPPVRAGAEAARPA